MFHADYKSRGQIVFTLKCHTEKRKIQKFAEKKYRLEANMAIVDPFLDSNTSETEQIFQMTTHYDNENSTIVTKIGRLPFNSNAKSTRDSKEDIWLTVAFRMQTTEIFDACMAFVFNLLNILAIASSRLHHRTTYRLLISLALADAIIVLSYGASDIYDIVCSVDTQPVKEIVVYNIYQISSMTCAFTYVTISVDLFAQIILPFKYRSMKGCFKVVLVVIWIVPVVVVESIQIGVTLIHMQANEALFDTYVRLRDNSYSISILA